MAKGWIARKNLKIAKLKNPYTIGNKTSKYVVHYGKTETGAYKAINTYPTRKAAYKAIKAKKY